MRAAGCKIIQHEAVRDEIFVPPTLIEIPDIAVLREEIFGPVLHVLRYASSGAMHCSRRSIAPATG